VARDRRVGELGGEGGRVVWMSVGAIEAVQALREVDLIGLERLQLCVSKEHRGDYPASAR